MNNIIALFVCASTTLFAIGQKNELSIESYKSFKFDTPSSFGDFESQYLQMGVGSDHHGVNLSLGLNYTRQLPNNWYARARPSFSIDHRSQQSMFSLSQEMGYEKYDESVEYEKKFSSVNLFVGAGKEFQLSDRFSLLVGVDVGLMLDQANFVNQTVDVAYQYESSTYNSTIAIDYERDFARYKRIGIMPVIAPVFQLNESFSISAELQYFAALSKINSEEKYFYKEQQRDYDPALVYEYEYELDLNFNTKASMFSISKLSPLLRFSYKF